MRIGLISVARSIVPPVVAPAPTVEWISSMKRIGIGRFASASITALKRSSKSPRKRVPASSAPVSSEKTSAPSRRSGTSSREQSRGESFGERRLADARIAHEHGIVLAAPAEDFHRPLQLVGAADQRIELAGARAIGQIHRVAASGSREVAVPRSPCRPRLRPRPESGPEPPPLDGTLLMPCVMYSSTSSRVMPCTGQQLRRKRLVLLQRCREHVARLDFLPARALHVQHGRLQHAPERERLLGLLLLSASELLDRFLEVFVEISPELRQICAARGENPLAVLIVRQRVQQVLERQVRMTPRCRLAVCDGENDFQA